MTWNYIKSHTDVHRVLAHSYSTYFIFFLIGVTLDIIFRLNIFSGEYMIPLGILFLVVATILILWAQKTGRDLRKIKEIKAEHFCRGPYCYTRSPTNWGLFFLMIGFGIIANAAFVVFSTLASFLVARFFFLDKEEAILASKYGTPYLEYKRKVKL